MGIIRAKVAKSKIIRLKKELSILENRLQEEKEKILYSNEYLNDYNDWFIVSFGRQLDMGGAYYTIGHLLDFTAGLLLDAQIKLEREKVDKNL